jgi:hypothetical protein
MDGYKIPKMFLPGFEELAKLEDENFKKLISIIKKVPVGVGSKTFHNSLKKGIKNQSIDDLAKTIYSLGALLILDVKNINQLIDDLLFSFKSQTNLKLNANKSKEFRERLGTILTNSRNIKLTFKAIDLRQENDRIYKTSRILSDIRVVFNEDLKNNDRYAVVIHQLKIESEKDGKKNNMFFALDFDDLIDFKEQIDRAIEKEEVLKNNYNMNLNFIELTQ